VFSGGPTKFYCDWGLRVAHCSHRSPLSAPAKLLDTSSNCLYAHKPWLPLSTSLFLGYIGLINKHLESQVGQEALQCIDICLYSPDTGAQCKWKEPHVPRQWPWQQSQHQTYVMKSISEVQEGLKGGEGTFWKCKLSFPHGVTQQHTSAEDMKTCYN
jgi:hypothetical protein